MSRPVVLGCLLLAACEPVLLAADEGKSIGGQQAQTAAIKDAGSDRPEGDADAEREETGAAEPNTASGSGSAANDVTAPQVQLTVKSVDCGSCYDLVAIGSGGTAPYRYEWDNGTSNDTRRVCVSTSELAISVIAVDAAGARSKAYITRLQANLDDAAACLGLGTAAAAVPMCLMNGSFEGTAAINTGGAFDAAPWKLCGTDTADMTPNTPSIANATLDLTMSGFAPQPTDGDTFVGMTSGEQVSQQLCQALNAGDKTFLRLDARLVQLGGTDMFLQILGGSSAECSTRQLLWVSPALTNDWLPYCMPLQPGEFMDLITLRAYQPNSNLVANVVAVDNLKPVDSCP